MGKKTNKTKTYILDTNVLMTSPYSIFSFDEHQVILIDVTLEELDRLKTIQGERGANAREVIRILEGLRALGALTEGVPLPGGGSFRIYPSDRDKGSSNFDSQKADNIILHSCKEINTQNENVILVTNDINMRVKAEVLSVRAEEYKTEQAAHPHEQYKGRCVATVASDAIDSFYAQKRLPTSAIKQFDLPEHKLSINEFVLLVDECDEKHSALARFDGSNLVPLKHDRISPYGIKPKNIGQKFAQEALMEAVENAPLVILKGPAGTAKTFYSLAVGLEQTLGKNPCFERILVARPNIKFDEDIGFLKGTEEDKIGPLIRPIMDNLEQLTRTEGRKDGNNEKSYAQDLFDRGTIVAQALAYMRGRSIADTWIIIDEAQNMSPTQAFGIVSRCGIGSKVILVGDPEQIDNPHLDARTNGLSYASERMRGSSLCWQVTFNDDECVRSALALEAIQRMPPKGMHNA